MRLGVCVCDSDKTGAWAFPFPFLCSGLRSCGRGLAWLWAFLGIIFYPLFFFCETLYFLFPPISLSLLVFFSYGVLVAGFFFSFFCFLGASLGGGSVIGC